MVQFDFEWGFYALSASKVIFRARTFNCITYSVQVVHGGTCNFTELTSTQREINVFFYFLVKVSQCYRPGAVIYIDRIDR